MSIFIFIGLVFVLICFPYIRIVAFNFFPFVVYTLKDICIYFKNMQFNVCPTGSIVCYAGLFGYGKTLSAVHYITSLYSRYNNKKCFVNGKWRTQKVLILSNVKLNNIPFIELTSLTQITEFTEKKPSLDGEEYYYVLLVLGDEFSTCLNSRSFKSNIDPIFLNTLVTSRHYSISLFYTSQRFNLVDKLLRDVTFYVVQCRRAGRVELNTKYEAFDLENCNNPTLVKPLKRTGFFIHDRDYNNYDTLAVVNNLIKSSAAGDMLSEKEIIEKLCPTGGNLENVGTYSYKMRKRLKERKGGRR